MRYSVIAVWLLSCGQVVAQTPPSAEAIRKSMQLDAGLRVELVACEPRITSPVHMAFDADGRLWVVEMRLSERSRAWATAVGTHPRA